VQGAHLKKLRRAEGGAKMFGVFRVKNHDITPKKNHIFSNFRGGGRPLLDPPLVCACFLVFYCLLCDCVQIMIEIIIVSLLNFIQNARHKSNLFEMENRSQPYPY
jgi:hypothetical protein